MKDFIKNFIKSGLKAAGFGPLILVIFYYIYYFLCCSFIKYLTINFHTISIQNVNKNILSSLLLAFIAGGISAVFKVEKISLGLATMIDAIVIYIDYLLFYVFNNWIELQLIPFLVFTALYIIGYVIIWFCIYHQVKIQVKQLNNKL